MHYTYILQSISNPSRFYVGSTNDLKRRIKEHNLGESIHTNKFIPWRIKSYIAFDKKEKSLNFEKYLKSGSVREFVKKFL